ncbi:MAG: hypothetical protein GX273_09405 [Bacteroidales bacterium]|nr:hypothetical protein [Bacteroidales bacterium]
MGNLIQYPSRSFSRNCIETNSNLFKKAKAIIGDKPIITFKKFKENDGDISFGAVEGHNDYEDKDIAVIGTPHLNELVYKLFALAMGIEVKNENMRYQEIKRNNCKFYFMTYKKKELRNIQLWLIESELEQAIGRARLLRNKCNVILFSNYPLKQAKFKYA